MCFMTLIAEQIAQELNVLPKQITAAIALLDDGATVPFIARYRKEKTQGLDDGHLRHLAQRLTYLRDLNERREVILNTIDEQGKLTQALKAELIKADNKTRLEDLYLPFRPKRRTKGQIAIEAGLLTLADALYQNWQLVPEQEAKQYIQVDETGNDNSKKLFSNVDDVLDGVIAILSERFAEDANLLQKLRNHCVKQAHVVSKGIKSKAKEGAKYRDYFEHSEKLQLVPSHRALAMFRGRNEGFLRLSLNVDPHQEKGQVASTEQIITDHYHLRLSSQPAAAFITKVIRSAWQHKLKSTLENELLGKLRESAEQEAMNVFSTNLSDVLMASPAGSKVTMGIDPGLRTGCKIAIVDATSKVLQTATIFPHAPQNHWDKSVRTLVNLAKQFKVELIAIGNGTGSRESDKLAGDAIKQLIDSEYGIEINKIIVSEAGASVYSASELAANEFPDLDVSIRGAVSIARRLQDPLAELVKIDPKAIGVGQYQHDVNQSQLSQQLDNVVEDCVNRVGVDLNSASASLLTRVAGLNKTMAKNIVDYREKNGRFETRTQLLNVARLGPKAYEQAAGFLRIREGKNLLEQSGVHPETYPIVDKIVQQLNQSLSDVIASPESLKKVNVIDIQQSDDVHFTELTIKDIIAELEKPGRDPRPAFKTASFKAGVETIHDLTVGMVLEGVISNVANFGAFVDVGVHQDGLVHISSLTNKFVSDPREIVKAGDIVKVKVTEVDAERKRISLTMRLDEVVKENNHTKSTSPSQAMNKSQNHSSKPKQTKKKIKEPANAAMGNAFADAFSKLKK